VRDRKREWVVQERGWPREELTKKNIKLKTYILKTIAHGRLGGFSKMYWAIIAHCRSCGGQE